MARVPDPEIRRASEARGSGWAVPMPAKRFVEDLYEEALPAAGAYDLVDSVDVFKSRLLHLFVSVRAAAIGNQVSIIPEVSMDPTGDSGSFYPIGVSDGTITLGDLAVDPAGDYTVHNFGSVVYTPMNITTPATVTAADELMMVISLDVNSAYWIRFQAAEFGNTASPATLVLKYSKSV